MCWKVLCTLTCHNNFKLVRRPSVIIRFTRPSNILTSIDQSFLLSKESKVTYVPDLDFTTVLVMDHPSITNEFHFICSGNSHATLRFIPVDLSRAEKG